VPRLRSDYSNLRPTLPPFFQRFSPPVLFFLPEHHHLLNFAPASGKMFPTSMPFLFRAPNFKTRFLPLSPLRSFFAYAPPKATSIARPARDLVFSLFLPSLGLITGSSSSRDFSSSQDVADHPQSFGRCRSAIAFSVCF